MEPSSYFNACFNDAGKERSGRLDPAGSGEARPPKVRRVARAFARSSSRLAREARPPRARSNSRRRTPACSPREKEGRGGNHGNATSAVLRQPRAPSRARTKNRLWQRWLAERSTSDRQKSCRREPQPLASATVAPKRWRTSPPTRATMTTRRTTGAPPRPRRPGRRRRPLQDPAPRPRAPRAESRRRRDPRRPRQVRDHGDDLFSLLGARPRADVLRVLPLQSGASARPPAAPAPAARGRGRPARPARPAPPRPRARPLARATRLTAPPRRSSRPRTRSAGRCRASSSRAPRRRATRRYSALDDAAGARRPDGTARGRGRGVPARASRREAPGRATRARLPLARLRH